MATFGKINRSASFNPTSAFPLDARYYFESLAEAQEAARGAVEVGSSEGTYFYGENLVVLEGGKATLYLIQPDKTLTGVGSALVGDGKSIEVVDGTVKIKGFGSATAGQQPRIGTDGDIEWYTPSTETVDGLKDTVAGHTNDISSLQENKADKTDVYTKEEVDGKISGVYHYKGSVETYSSLPKSPAVGDVYNIVNADTAHGIKAGDNVAWSGTEWDILGGTVDLSAYVTTEAMNTALNDYVQTTDPRLMTSDEKEKLAGIEENAQKNLIENVKINGEALIISDKAVNIPIAGESLGVIKSATGENMITVSASGEASVASVNVNTLVQTEGDTLILIGGSSSI